MTDETTGPPNGAAHAEELPEEAADRRTIETTLDLPSGRTATLYKGKAKHFFNARKVAGREEEMFYYSLFAQLVEVDGRSIRADDWAEEDMADTIALMNAFDGLAGN